MACPMFASNKEAAWPTITPLMPTAPPLTVQCRTVVLAISFGVAAIVIGICVARLRHNVDLQYQLRAIAFDATTISEMRKLIFVGDSRVVSLQCEKELPVWHVLNLGFAGKTAGQSLGLAQRYLGLLPKARAAVVWVGVNDVMLGRQVHRVVEDTVALIDIIHRSSEHVLFLGQFPVRTDDLYTQSINLRLDNINEEMSKVANAHGYDVALLPLKETGPGQSEFYLDSLHLNASGNQLVCKTIANWLAAI
jgi:lysophospholipase L1-like esterase